MIRHYSTCIQNEIQKELFKSEHTIKIAVAWFTNELLFQPLIMKLQLGVKISIVLNHDEINVSDSNDIDFSSFVNAGGELRWNRTNKLMHDKFCIIDDSVVISGSYNWTNKAEYNDESIAIYENEADTLAFYNSKFENFCRLLEPEAPTKTKITEKIPQKPAKPLAMTTPPSEPTYLLEGTCGEGVTFKLKKNGNLSITGKGLMDNFESLENRPWNNVIDKIVSIDISTKAIGARAFEGAQNLKSVNVNHLSHLKRIGTCAFKDCTKLKDVYGQAEEIGAMAFKGCISLTGCMQTKRIGDYAYSCCTSLASFRIDSHDFVDSHKWYDSHKEIKCIEHYKFTNTLGRPPIYIPNIEYELSKENELTYSQLKKIEASFQPSLRIEGVEQIGKCAFEMCTSLQYASFPKSLMSVGDLIFAGCTNLKEVWFSDGILVMGDDLFAGCHFLEKIKIPDYVRFRDESFGTARDKVEKYLAVYNRCVLWSMAKNYTVSFVNIEDIPEKHGYIIHPNIYSGDTVVFSDHPICICAKESPNDKKGIWYFVDVIHNGHKKWMSLDVFTIVDLKGHPIDTFRKRMLELGDWKTRLDYLKGKTIIGGDIIEYEHKLWRNGIETDEVKTRKSARLTLKNED